MSFLANKDTEFELWDYITGNSFIYPKTFYGEYNPKIGMSIASKRYDFLLNMYFKERDFKVALRDPLTNKWTKWVSFPGLLWKERRNSWGPNGAELTAAIDVHRSILENEIIIESDYPTYEENYKSSKIIGEILEKKGFIPHYYFSGNKSIHIHVYISKEFIDAVEIFLDYRLNVLLGKRQKKIVDYFMEWLRKKMITCWDTRAKEFDRGLIKTTHLIRAELSRNKKGFKTFLGYTHKDLSFVPQICNEKNRIYPRLAKIMESVPSEPIELIEEFIEFYKLNKQYKQTKKKNTLSNWIEGIKKDDLKKEVKEILSDSFKDAKDGYKRAAFILINELKTIYSWKETEEKVLDWNRRMGFPLKEEDIKYRVKINKHFNLSPQYIRDFLNEIGFKA